MNEKKASTEELVSQVLALTQRIASLESSISDSRRQERLLADRIDFDKMVSDLSASFVRVPVHEIDMEIEKWLRRIVQHYGVDGCILVEPMGSKSAPAVTHTWAKKPEYRQSAIDTFQHDLPWVTDMLSRGETVAYESVEDIPAQAKAEREFFTKNGPLSAAAIPLHVSGEYAAIVGAASFEATFAWTDEHLRRLRLVGEIFASALKRKQSESALSRAEQTYRTFFETTTDAVFLMDDRLFRDCNHETLRMFECSHLSDIVGFSPIDFSPRIQPDGTPSEEKGRRLIDLALKGEKQVFSWQHLTKNGNTIDAEVALNRLELEDETLLLAVVKNTSERVRVEHKLQESEQRFGTLVENIPGVVWTSDADGQITFVSPNVALVNGYTPDEIYEGGLGVWRGRIHPEDFDRVRNALDELTGSGTMYDLEYRVRRKDGQWIWLHDRAYRTHDDRGKVRLDGIFTDVTDRKRAELALRESEERYRAVVEDQADFVCRSLPDTTITFVNDAFCRYFGIRQSQMVGTRLLNQIPEEDQIAVLDFFRSFTPDKLEDAITYRALSAKGVVNWLTWNYRAVFDQDGNLVEFQGVGRDITAQREAEEAAGRSRALLMAAIEQSPVGILVAQASDQRIMIANSAAVEIRGETPSPLVEIALDLHPQNWQTYLPSGELYPVDELPLSRAIMEGETSTNVEMIIRRDDGSERWVTSNAAPVTDLSGEIVAGVVVFSDVTEAKQAQEDLEETARKLKLEQAALKEKHTALTEILEHMEKDKLEFRHDIAASVKDLLGPIVKRVKNSSGQISKRDMGLLEDAIESIVGEDIHQFADNYSKLTPREIEICDMIRDGFSTKEIADTLSVSSQTVEKHRTAIRRKLQISNKEINLASYLKNR